MVFNQKNNMGIHLKRQLKTAANKLFDRDTTM